MRKPSATNLGQELGTSSQSRCLLGWKVRVAHSYVGMQGAHLSLCGRRSLHSPTRRVNSPPPAPQPAVPREVQTAPRVCSCPRLPPKDWAPESLQWLPCSANWCILGCLFSRRRTGMRNPEDWDAVGRVQLSASICSTNLVLCMLIVGVKSWYPRDAAARPRPTIQKRRYVVVLNSWCILGIVIY